MGKDTPDGTQFVKKHLDGVGASDIESEILILFSPPFVRSYGGPHLFGALALVMHSSTPLSG